MLVLVAGIVLIVLGVLMALSEFWSPFFAEWIIFVGIFVAILGVVLSLIYLMNRRQRIARDPDQPT